jgi:fatty-acyl-CoA synthase
VLDEMARWRGSSPAIFYFDETVSYRELQQRAREAARSLLAAGVRRGDRVGVLLGNQPEWLVLCFAAAQIGATFVPLNTWYKKSELEWTIRHCELSLLVFTPRFLKQDFAAMLTELQCAEFPKLRSVVALGGEVRGTLRWTDFLAAGGSVSLAELERAASAVSGEDIAFILYTSGSLAEPKGVLLNHRGVVENCLSMGERRAITADDRIWLGSPLFYGLGATNAMPIALTHGASLVLQGSFDPGIAIRAIASTEATTYYGTGNMTRAILDHPDYSPGKTGSLKKAMPEPWPNTSG